MNLKSNLNVLLSLLSMVFLVYIGSTWLKSFKIDFTEEKIYSLSEGSKQILKKVKSPLKLKLFYSKLAANKGSEGLRQFNNYAKYIHELLKEYEHYSQNKVKVQVIDPRPDTEEEEEALAYGLKKFNLTQTETYFFGLAAVNQSGAEKIIEFFDPANKDKVEYQISELIHSIQNPKKKQIGLLSSVQVMVDDMNPYMAQIMRMQGKSVEQSWAVMQMLQQNFEIKKIEPTSEEIVGVDSLVIIHPKGFSDKLLYAIDQFVMGGGNLLVMADPHLVSDGPTQPGQPPSSSPDENFMKLTKKWGFEIPAGTFVGDKTLSQNGRVHPNQPESKLLALLACKEICVDKYNEPISTGVKSALFVLPGLIKVNQLDGVQAFPIIATSAKGNSYQASIYDLNNPSALLDKFKEGKEPAPVGYKFVGKFSSAYDKAPGSLTGKKKDDKNDKGREHLTQSVKESAVVVFSDIDFIADQFAFRRSFVGMSPRNDNSALMLNAVDSLSGDVDLMSVRTKGRKDRSFDVINSIEEQAAAGTEKKVAEINSSIKKFQQELSQLSQKANEENIALLQNEGLKKRKALGKKIALLKKELRAVKRGGREKVEGLGNVFKYINTLFIPFFLVLVGYFYLRKRNLLQKKSA